MGHARAQQLADSFENAIHVFPCHKTTDWVENEDGFTEQRQTDKTVACAGMIIMAEKSPGHSNGLRVAGRLGLHNPAILDMDSPVYDDYQAFVDDHDPNQGDAQ